MSALDLAVVMQAIADTIIEAGVTERAYGWPVKKAQVPAAIVSYPEDDIEFDVTFGRACDKAIFPVFIAVGNVHDQSARDVLSTYITGARGIKDALDGDLGGAVQTARVTSCAVDVITLGGIEYLAAKLLIEVYT